MQENRKGQTPSNRGTQSYDPFRGSRVAGFNALMKKGKPDFPISARNEKRWPEKEWSSGGKEVMPEGLSKRERGGDEAR